MQPSGVIPGFLTAMCWLVSYVSLARLGIPHIVALSSGVYEDVSRRQQHLDYQTLLTNVVSIIQSTGGYIDQRDEGKENFLPFPIRAPGSQDSGTYTVALQVPRPLASSWLLWLSSTLEEQCGPSQPPTAVSHSKLAPPTSLATLLTLLERTLMYQAKVTHFNTLLITTQWSQTILLFHASLYHTFNIL